MPQRISCIPRSDSPKKCVDLSYNRPPKLTGMSGWALSIPNRGARLMETAWMGRHNRSHPHMIADKGNAAMNPEYKTHVEERARLGAPPLALNPDQTRQLCEQLLNPPQGEDHRHVSRPQLFSVVAVRHLLLQQTKRPRGLIPWASLGLCVRSISGALRRSGGLSSRDISNPCLAFARASGRAYGPAAVAWRRIS